MEPQIRYALTTATSSGHRSFLGSRIKDQAGGGEILVPEAVRHMLSGKGFRFSDRGESALKGFEDAVRLYDVGGRSNATR